MIDVKIADIDRILGDVADVEDISLCSVPNEGEGKCGTCAACARPEFSFTTDCPKNCLVENFEGNVRRCERQIENEHIEIIWSGVRKQRRENIKFCESETRVVEVERTGDVRGVAKKCKIVGGIRTDLRDEDRTELGEEFGLVCEIDWCYRF